MFVLDSSLRDSWQSQSSAWVTAMPEGWMQGRSVYGGVTVAKMAALCLKEAGPQWSLRSFQVQLMNPVSPGPVSAQRRVLRSGSSTEFVAVELFQEQRSLGQAQFILAKARERSLSVDHSPRGPQAEPEGLPELRYVPGVFPEFVKHVDMRWSEGGPPFSGADQAQYQGFCRFRAPIGDVEGLIALLDVWPCPSLSLLTAPSFASTVTWSAHILRAPSHFEGWFGFSYKTISGKDGFHTVLGHLYGPDGEYLAMTEQLVVLFD